MEEVFQEIRVQAFIVNKKSMSAHLEDAYTRGALEKWKTASRALMNNVQERGHTRNSITSANRHSVMLDVARTLIT